MKYLLIIFLITSVCSFGQTDVSKSERANNTLLELVTSYKAKGVVGGVSIDSKTVWDASFGYSDVNNKIPAQTDMLTRIASIAKPMTAIAIMQLYEKGLVELDKPIQYYIKEFPKQTNHQITVRHLLNHTSGIKGYASRKEAKGGKNYETLTAAMNVFINRKTEGIPGESYHYSTYGYVVLGVLIERISGETFEEYMIKNIWNIADMKNTGVEKYDTVYVGKSQLFHKDKKGKVTYVNKTSNLSNRIPGGGFYSCLGDLLKFGEAVLNNVLIKPETLALMLENNGIKKQGNPYGLGWFLYGIKSDQSRVFGHSGAQLGASTQLLIIPSSKTVIVVLANTSGVPDVMGAIIQLNTIFKDSLD